MKKLVFLIALSILTAINAAVIVQDGKPQAEIILGDNPVPVAKFAAKELNTHIKLISGTELPIVKKRGTAKTAIYVGFVPGKKIDFKEQEYLISVSGNEIILAGKDCAIDKKNRWGNLFDHRATCYAVYDFLERLGIRWYLPTEIGTVYTPSKNISVPDMKKQFTPDMNYRWTNIYHQIPADFAGSFERGAEANKKVISLDEAWLWFNRLRVGGKSRSVHHSFHRFYLRYIKKHPEWFNQAVKPSQTPQPCYSHPEVIAQTVQELRDYFDKKPNSWQYVEFIKSDVDSDTVGIAPLDTNRWCTCDRCKPLYDTTDNRGDSFYNAKKSAYYFTFVNKVAKELAKTHPDKKLATLAYWEYSYPPRNFKLEPNVEIAMTLSVRNVYSPEALANIQERLDVWKKTNPHVSKTVWLYYCFPSQLGMHGRFNVFPGFFADHLEGQFKKLYEAGVTGFVYEPSYQGDDRRNMLMDQLEHYITTKLAFDKNYDAKAGIDEFFKLYYGKAGDVMKTIYREMEAAYSDPANYPKNVTGREELSWKYIGTPARMKRYGELFTQAEKIAAAQGGVYFKRFEIFKKGIWEKMLAGFKRYSNLKGMMENSMKRGFAPRLQAGTEGDPKTIDWKKAGVLGMWGGLKGGKPARNIIAKVAHDGKYLYIRVEDPIAFSELKNGLFWADGFEFFFAGTRGKPYAQICIGNSGDFDSRNFSEMHGEVLYPGKTKTFVDKSNAKRYVLLCAIPLSEIYGQPGKILYGNILRSRNQYCEAAWIPTYAGHHSPSRFGEIYLEK